MLLHTITIMLQAAGMQASLTATPETLKVGNFFKFDPIINVSELLTACSILIAITTFSNTLWKGIKDRRDAEADKVRAAAAKGLSKLQRWCKLALWYYTDIKPLLVETSEKVFEDDRVSKARDFLWKSLEAARIVTLQRMLNESLECAYVELCSYYPASYEPFAQTLAMLDSVETMHHSDLMVFLQDDVNRYNPRPDKFVPAMLGNDLRSTCAAVHKLFEKDMREIASPLEAFLVTVIKSSSSEIHRKRKQAVSLTPPTSSVNRNI